MKVRGVCTQWVHTKLSTRYLKPSSNCALDHQSRSRSALDQYMRSPNHQRRKIAQRAALPRPRVRSGSLTVSWAETKRLPVRELSRIWWRTTSSFPFRGTSSGATAWAILVPFSIDRIGRFWGPWRFFFFFQNWNRILSCLKLEMKWFLGKLQTRVQATAAVINRQHFFL